MSGRPFAQVDVFPGGDLAGNPVAVVLDAAGLDDGRMQAFARWTNLSETTFVLPTDDPGADYRLRIFTPAEELPFAGHPTLGSAHAWLEHTGSTAGRVVQECGAGLVPVRRSAEGFALQAPPLVHSGAASDAERDDAARSLRIGSDAVVAAEWVDNGPGWLALRLADAEAVLALEPDFTAMPFPVGVVGAHPPGGPADFEVRAFVPGLGVPEDPVTGSLNAGIGTWFFGTRTVDGAYTVRQGTALQRNGLVRVSRDADGVWVSGATRTVLRGTVDL